METYGDLDFTLTHGQVLLVVDIHPLEGIFAAVASLHQKHDRKPT